MIDQNQYTRATEMAFEVASNLRGLEGGLPRNLIVASAKDPLPRTHLRRICKRIGKARVVHSGKIERGYGSWLMHTGKERTIAVNARQLKKWSSSYPLSDGKQPGVISGFMLRFVQEDFKAACEARRRAMEIRCILHELGHILLQPELLDEDRFNREATPDQEEAPWVFACAVLGIALADHARGRRTTDGYDDSPCMPL